MNNSRSLRLFSIQIILVLLLVATGGVEAVITSGNTSTATDTTGPVFNTISHVGRGGRRERNNCGALTPPIPGGVVANDLLIASIAARNNGTNVAITSGAAGWVLFGTSTYAGQALKSFLYYKIATATNAVTFTTSGACSTTGVRVVAFRGVDTVDPIEPLPIPYVTGNTNVTQTNTNNITTGSITTTVAEAMVVVSTYINNLRSVNEANGFLQSFDDRRNTPQRYGHGLFYLLQTTAGSKSVSGWNLNPGGNNQNIDFIYALKPGSTIVDPTSLTIAVPAATAPGDVMIATIAITSNVTVTANVDWTLQNRVDHTDTRSAQMVYSRVVDGTEPANYTWNFGAGVTTDAAGGIVTYSGVDTANPIDLIAGNETASNTDHTASSITTSVADAMVISSHSFTSSETWTEPVSMTEQVDIASRTPSDIDGISLEMNDALQASAGATADKTATAGGNADTGITHLLALRPYVPVAADVEYRMDETTWGTVFDASGNGVDGSLVGAGVVSAPHLATTPDPALISNLGTCGYGDFPNNTNNTIAGIDTTFTPGNVGSISFWFNNKNNWNASGDRLLFDASNDLGNNGADKLFFLVRRNNNNGSLRFRMEDDADLDKQVEVINLSFLAGEWVHIAVTWDVPGNQMQMYVNGSLSATNAVATSGTIGNVQSLYIGDQRTTGVGGGGWSNDSANGYIDEFKIYNQVISPAQVINDLSTRHPCVTVDHYAINFPVTPAVTCEALEVDIEAHADAIVHTQLATPANATVITVTANVVTAGDVVWQEGAGGNGSLVNGVPGAGQAQYTFNGTESSVKLFLRYPNAETNVSVNVSDGAASDTVGAEDPTVDFVLTVFRFLDNTDSNIGTQIAGKSSGTAPGIQTLQLRAVQTNTTTLECEAALDGAAIPVDFAYQCDNPVTCAIANNGISVTAAETKNIDDVLLGYTPVNMDFNIAGIAEFSFTYTDAGEISLLAQKALAADPLATPPTTAFTLQGTSAPFVVRPFAFDIDSAGTRAADWGDLTFDCDNSNLSCAQDATSTTVLARAGNSSNVFPVTIRAVAWESADDDGIPAGSANDGIPDTGANLTDNSLTPNFGHETATETVEVTHTLVRPGMPGATGTLFMGSALDFSGASGSITTNLAFDEVGIINLTASLTSGNYLSGGSDVTATHENFGRFTPDRLTITDNGPALINTCTAGSFTYQDETFFYASAPTLTVTAVNEAGGTTLNYGDENPTNPAERFWKLPRELARTYLDQAGAAAIGAGLDVATVSISGDLNYDGTADLSLSNTAIDRDSFLYTRVSEEGPFAASFDVTFHVQTAVPRSLIDTDDVCFDGDADGTCETDGSDDYKNLTVAGAGSPLGGASLRFGRLNIGSAVGSELLPLNPPFVVEYHDGTSFVRNTDDNACTSLDLADHVRLENSGTRVAGNSIMTIGSGNTSITSFNSPLVAGDSGMQFAAPLSGNTGFVNISANLDCSDLTVACIGSTLFNHLLYDWEENGGFDENPTGRIDFGVYQGPREFIYLREPWN